MHIRSCIFKIVWEQQLVCFPNKAKLIWQLYLSLFVQPFPFIFPFFSISCLTPVKFAKNLSNKISNTLSSCTPLTGKCKQPSPWMKGGQKDIWHREMFVLHDRNTGKIYKARIIMARTLRGCMTLIYGNLGFPIFILVEIIVPVKFAGMVTAVFSCVVPTGSSFLQIN